MKRPLTSAKRQRKKMAQSSEFAFNAPIAQGELFGGVGKSCDDDRAVARPDSIERRLTARRQRQVLRRCMRAIVRHEWNPSDSDPFRAIARFSAAPQNTASVLASCVKVGNAAQEPILPSTGNNSRKAISTSDIENGSKASDDGAKFVLRTTRPKDRSKDVRPALAELPSNSLVAPSVSNKALQGDFKNAMRKAVKDVDPEIKDTAWVRDGMRNIIRIDMHSPTLRNSCPKPKVTIFDLSMRRFANLITVAPDSMSSVCLVTKSLADALTEGNKKERNGAFRETYTGLGGPVKPAYGLELLIFFNEKWFRIQFDVLHDNDMPQRLPVLLSYEASITMGILSPGSSNE